MIKKMLILTAAMLFSINSFCVNVNVHNKSKTRLLVRPYGVNHQLLYKDGDEGYGFIEPDGTLRFDAGNRRGLLGEPIIGTAGDCYVEWQGPRGINVGFHTSRLLKNPASIIIRDNGKYTVLDEQGTIWPFQKNNEEVAK